MDAAILGIAVTFAVGIAAAAASAIGAARQARATHQGAVMVGYGGLVNELQEERADLRTKLAAAREEIADRDRQIAELTAQLAAARGGPTP